MPIGHYAALCQQQASVLAEEKHSSPERGELGCSHRKGLSSVCTGPYRGICFCTANWLSPVVLEKASVKSHRKPEPCQNSTP